MRKVFFIIPTAQRFFLKNLIGVIPVRMIVVKPDLQGENGKDRRSDFAGELLRGEKCSLNDANIFTEAAVL